MAALLVENKINIWTTVKSCNVLLQYFKKMYQLSV